MSDMPESCWIQEQQLHDDGRHSFLIHVEKRFEYEIERIATSLWEIFLAAVPHNKMEFRQQFKSTVWWVLVTHKSKTVRYMNRL